MPDKKKRAKKQPPPLSGRSDGSYDDGDFEIDTSFSEEVDALVKTNRKERRQIMKHVREIQDELDAINDFEIEGDEWD